MGAALGLSAGIAGIGSAEVVAGTSARLRSPVLDVGDRVIDRVPSWVKDLAIRWFDTNDKIALLVGIGGLLAVYAAMLGTLALRGRVRTALVGCAVFGAAGSYAALGARMGSQWWSPLPSVVGAAVAAAVLWGLSQALLPATSTKDTATGNAVATRSTGNAASPTGGPSRRAVVASLGAVAVVGGGLGAMGRRLEGRFSAAASRAAIRLPRANVPAAPLPVEAELAGSAPFFTPNDSFYRIDTALSVPQVRAEQWDLRITGKVDRPLTLSYDALLRRELVEADITLTCVSNTVGGELIGTARWLGVRLDDLLEEAGIGEGADQIVGRSVDGYTCGFPVEALDGRDALVAIGMNGEPLPLQHGFPARLIVPGIYGYASATKWLSEIELTSFDDFDHYWVPRGYAAKAPIKMQSRIDAPRGLDRIAAEPFVIRGVAWAQPTGISAVEVRIDGDTWQAAELGAAVNESTWRQWNLPWDPTPGRHTIEVRAVDQDGAIQTDERSEPLPNGASGHHTVVVLVDEP